MERYCISHMKNAFFRLRNRDDHLLHSHNTFVRRQIQIHFLNGDLIAGWIYVDAVQLTVRTDCEIAGHCLRASPESDTQPIDDVAHGEKADGQAGSH